MHEPRPSDPGLDVDVLPAATATTPEDAAVTARRVRRRKRWLVAAPLLGVLLWGAGSYTTWMLQPTSMSFVARSVEWVRGDVPLGNQIVDTAEHDYYGWKAPKKGGPTLAVLPAVGLGRPASGQVESGPSRAHASSWPRPIAPVYGVPLAGEGVWSPTGSPVDGGPPVLVTTYRPELAYPRLVAYIGWFDHTRTAIGYYPGRYEPPAAAVRGPMMVPHDQRSRLLATFNGGFTYVDGHNGSTDNGLVNEPLKRGNATLVGYRDGRLDILDWNGGANAAGNVAWSRQSLAPIVWDGVVNPALNTDPNSPQWGYTLGGVTRTWRTGVGIDRRGNLLYVAAPDQTVISLAKILQHIGAVRAMEFDINPEWHTFITYRDGLHPTPVEPNHLQSSNRYLTPDDRDFFTVYARLEGPISVPFG
jgi:hypothetical protein